MSETPSGSRAPQTAFPMPPIPESLRRASFAAGPPLEPDFTLLNERPMKLADYRGQVVVLDSLRYVVPAMPRTGSASGFCSKSALGGRD
ncbi:MAG: hypothetical protein WKF84_17520 [Pyrinomonadaceae bacterium]